MSSIVIPDGARCANLLPTGRECEMEFKFCEGAESEEPLTAPCGHLLCAGCAATAVNCPLCFEVQPLGGNLKRATTLARFATQAYHPKYPTIRPKLCYQCADDDMPGTVADFLLTAEASPRFLCHDHAIIARRTGRPPSLCPHLPLLSGLVYAIMHMSTCV